MYSILFFISNELIDFSEFTKLFQVFLRFKNKIEVLKNE